LGLCVIPDPLKNSRAKTLSFLQINNEDFQTIHVPFGVCSDLW
jgi:hypothetical protein